MAAQQPTLSFRLPSGRDVEVFLIQLPDGRVVARTRDELEPLPPELRTPLTPPPAASSK